MSFVCIICRDLLTNKPPEVDVHHVQVDLVATKCGHMFHLICLEDWFNVQNKPTQECPMCNSLVATTDYRRLFPSGDEESEAIDENINQLQHQNHEIGQLKLQNKDIIKTLNYEMLYNDIARYESELSQSEYNHQLNIANLALKDEKALFQEEKRNLDQIKNNIQDSKQCLQEEINRMQILRDQEKARHADEVRVLSEEIRDSKRTVENFHKLFKSMELQPHLNLNKNPFGGGMTEKFTQTENNVEVYQSADDCKNRLTMYNICIKHLQSEEQRLMKLYKPFNETDLNNMAQNGCLNNSSIDLPPDRSSVFFQPENRLLNSSKSENVQMSSLNSTQYCNDASAPSTRVFITPIRRPIQEFPYDVLLPALSSSCLYDAGDIKLEDTDANCSPLDANVKTERK